MSNVKKVTKREYFGALRAMVEQLDAVGEYTADEVLEFIDAQVAQLDAKAAKAKEKAAEKRADGDELRGKVLEVVTETAQTADDIVAALDDVEITKSKVVARLAQLVNSGDVIKEEVKIENVGKRMTYRLA